jgi:Ca-activated chloride channel family protein
MIRSLEFHFHSPGAMLLLVAVPLVLIALLVLERSRAGKGPDAGAAGRPGVRRARLVILTLAVVATLGGGVLTFWVLVATNEKVHASPVFIAGLILLGLAVLLSAVAIILRRRSRAVLRFPSLEILKRISAGCPSRARYLAPFFFLLAVLLVLVALARPQVASTEADVFAEGMDIVLTLDVSTSMRAVDFAPPSSPYEKKSRIQGAKEVIADFIKQREEDRLGLVVFAGKAFTQCPLTLDYSVVQTILGSVTTADKAKIKDGTAIGDAIMVSINRLRESEAKSKAIILLTDGDDNASEVAPLQAAAGAAGEGIKVFPILVGKGGTVLYPAGKNVFGQVQYRQGEVRTNPELLRDIAKTADGKFYRAVDQQALEKDFQDILDHMEKTRLMDPGKFTRHTEVFQLALLPALLSVLLGLAVGWTRFRRFP